MGRKSGTTEEWKTYPIVMSNPSTVRKYFDVCQTWWVNAEGMPSVSSSPTFRCAQQSITHTREHVMGLHESEIFNATEFKCGICSEQSNVHMDGKCVTANPFTRAQFILLCHVCHSKLTAFR